MAKKYEVDGKYFLPVTVFTTDARSINPIGVQYVFAGNGNKGTTYLDDYPDLLLTAEEVAENVDTIARSTLDEYSEKAQRKIEALTKQLEEANETIRAFSESENIVRTNFDAKVDENRELKARNAELDALLKEVMATRDEAIKQNNELIAENKKLKADCNEWKDTANERLNAVQTLSAERNKVMAGVDELKNTLVDRTKDVQHLTEENDKLKTDLDQRNKDFYAMKKDRDNILADNKRTTAYYMEANRTASEAAEANDELKAKIADLRNRVGEQLAQIQDLNAEVHFLKADRDKFAKNAKDKADLANKACDERNDAQGDLVTAKAAIDYLQEENKKLKQEHKDVEAAYDVVAETSIKRKNRITTMEEVIVALVEKIRRLESGD